MTETIDLGAVVHVAPPGGPCRAGIIVDVGPSQTRVRVFRPGSTGPVGERDEEGDFRHWRNPLVVPNPPDLVETMGETRTLDSWHVPGGVDCYAVNHPPQRSPRVGEVWTPEGATGRDLSTAAPSSGGRGFIQSPPRDVTDPRSRRWVEPPDPVD